MKNTVLYTILISISLSLASCAPRISVKGPDYSSSRVRKDGFNFSLIQSISVLDFIDYKDEPNSGKYVAEAFMKKLIDKDYDVIESSKLSEVIEAKGLAKPENIDLDLFREIKELIKIDVLLTGTVTDYVEFTEPAPPGKNKKDVFIPKTVAFVGINARFIDVKSGNIVWMESVKARGERISETLNDAVNKIINTFLNDLY